MKLNDVRPNIETSGELEEQFFSIQDQGMIFDILRNKMYSNPILAICREISCNARDAHREVGSSDVPVQITLPNALEPFYKIKDFGPGISPDRMANIFIKYTASTKRNDNVQTGGFGLGAKTPFSYSDTFTILTNHNGVQYNYACFIDETKVGKLALMSETPTKEKNGTEIIIPVKPQDFRSFNDYTEQSTRYWEVHPTIKGGNIQWREVIKIWEGKNWSITSSSEYGYNRQAKLIIDGIEYPLEMEALRKYADPKMIEAARGNFVMHFGVGELSLSASREQVYLDKPTQDKIRQRLSDISDEVRKCANEKIDTFTNLWDANLYYFTELSKAFNNLSFLGQLKWKGCELAQDHYLRTSCNVYTFRRGKYSRKHGNDPNKLTRSVNQHITFNEACALYINDLPLKEPTPRHVKKAFEDDPNLQILQLICPNDKVTEDSLNKDISLDKMLPKRLSAITKAHARTYTPASSRLLLFKFDVKSCSFRQVSYASVEEDQNDKVLCLLNKYDGSREVYLKSQKNVSIYTLRELMESYPNTSFYGVDQSTPDNRIKEEFGDFDEIESFIKDTVLKNKALDFVAMKFAQEVSIEDRWTKELARIEIAIKDPNSLFLKKMRATVKIRKMQREKSNLLSTYETFIGEIGKKELKQFAKDNPDLDIEKIDSEYKKKYAILEFVQPHSYYGADVLASVLDYVNMIDKI